MERIHRVLFHTIRSDIEGLRTLALIWRFQKPVYFIAIVFEVESHPRELCPVCVGEKIRPPADFVNVEVRLAVLVAFSGVLEEIL